MAEAISSMEAMVSWDEVVEMDRNGVITQYQVLLQPSGEVAMLAMDNFTALNVTVTGLEEHILYSITVRAFTVAGAGPFSSPPVQVMTDPGSKLLPAHIGHSHVNSHW